MLMGRNVKVCRPQNIFGASEEDRAAVFSWTNEVDEDLFKNVKKNK